MLGKLHIKEFMTANVGHRHLMILLKFSLNPLSSVSSIFEEGK